jgi:hypothetical protein
MSVQTPMGEGAKFTIERHVEAGVFLDDEDTAAGVIPLAIAYFEDGHGSRRAIAWQTPDSTLEDFRWLISSAAAFHSSTTLEDHTSEGLNDNEYNT